MSTSFFKFLSFYERYLQMPGERKSSRFFRGLCNSLENKIDAGSMTLTVKAFIKGGQILKQDAIIKMARD
jgi:hypothetical protein